MWFTAPIARVVQAAPQNFMSRLPVRELRRSSFWNTPALIWRSMNAAVGTTTS
jgi:hypothetical protein